MAEDLIFYSSYAFAKPSSAMLSTTAATAEETNASVSMNAPSTFVPPEQRKISAGRADCAAAAAAPPTSYAGDHARVLVPLSLVAT